MSDPREAFEAYLENGQGNADHQGRYIGDPLDLWLAAWEEALSTQPQAPQGAVTDAERYEFLRNSAQRYQGDGMHPIDGSVWVVKYSHPKGTIPVMKSAGMGVELDANVDAAIRAAAPETPEGKK